MRGDHVRFGFIVWGTPVSEDARVFEDDERFWVGCGLSFDESMIIIESSSKTTSEVSHLLVDDIDSTSANSDSRSRRFKAFIPRCEGVEYDVELCTFRRYG